MPDLRLEDGSRLFAQMRGTHATELETPEGRILIRPDGYIASIGAAGASEYAGASVRSVRTLKHVGR